MCRWAPVASFLCDCCVLPGRATACCCAPLVQPPLTVSQGTRVQCGNRVLLSSMKSAVTGVVQQPKKGYEQAGSKRTSQAKGVAAGIGKGAVGLVTKPLAGTFGFGTEVSVGAQAAGVSWPGIRAPESGWR